MSENVKMYLCKFADYLSLIGCLQMTSLQGHVYLFISLLPTVVCWDRKMALLVIDIQNCFMPGGSLAAEYAELIVPVVNNIRQYHEHKFDIVIYLKDWHCPNDVAFASQYPGKRPFDKVTLKYNGRGVRQI